MTLKTIALNNLRRRKARMAFLVIGLLVGIATVVALVSLTEAMTMETEHKLDQFGANILITPRSDDLSISYGGITVGDVAVQYEPIREADLPLIRTIEERRNIAAVAPKVLGAVTVNEQRVVLMGVDRNIEFDLKRWWVIDGRAPETDDEMVAGRDVAAALGLNMGDSVPVNGRIFTLTGILQETGSQDDRMLITSLAPAQELLGKQGLISLVEVAALCADCPVEVIVAQIAEVLPYTRVLALQQVVASRMHAIDQFRLLSLSVAGVVVFIGALVVFVTMMGSVNERTREIGIFRALGFRRGHVVGLILLEAFVVSLLAGILGYLSGIGITKALLPFLATEHPHFDLSLLLMGGSILLAVIVGALASLYPALHASRMDPTEALRAL
ncbi:ABC transporter permease [Geoalkalibacter halelectricus]|uniref:ABC transporter permease n=1 Tax=Geoalkalibacter halelectricus TaxID=2847045 RepID=A0ABY5ZNC7_9BACT|nr:FtsX-like permease family protein [Geoalkalibacter halelectricus]MDO3379366.1 ABC transporter permease [Geoalkalibacter halelectricus]UWZ78756.1 ABC transporter permease [Geoalkalibacter halelectricus]